jgi:hypothetical protein
VGARGEYIRWGYKESKWHDSYMRFHESGINLGIQTCYSILNSLTIDQVGDWYFENLPQPLYGSLTMWNGHRAFDPKLLQLAPDLQNRAIQILEQILVDRRCPENWHVNIRGHINYIKSDLEYPALLKKATNFVNGIPALDRARNTDFNSTFPELVEFRTMLEDLVKNEQQ